MGTVMNESRRQILLDTPHTETATGAIASFETDMVGRAKEVKVEIEPVQDLHGYESPWPGGGGKNKLDIDALINAEGGRFPGSNYNFKHMLVLTLKPSTRYTLSTSYNGTTNVIYLNNSVVASAVKENEPKTATTDENGIIRVGLFDRTGIEEFEAKTVTVQLEEGSAATTYSPYSNICPISGWDSVTVTRTGVNVWDEEWQLNANRIESKNYIPVCPNTQYAWVSPTEPSNGLRFYDSNKRLIKTIYSVTGGKFTTPENCYFIWFAVSSTYGTTYNHDISINYPATATAYAPYSGSTTPISWLSSAGTVYGGYLEWLRDGTVRVTKTHESVNLSSLTWQRRSTNPYRFSASLPSGKDYTNAVDVSQHKCSIFPTAYTPGINSTREGYLGIYRIPTQIGADSTIYLRFADTVTTLTELNAFLAETNAQYCYPLATPVTYTLTPQGALVFLRGTNHVWNDINDTTVTYWTHKTGDSV